MISPNFLLACLVALLLGATALNAADVPVGSLNLSHARQSWGEPKANRSVDGNPITLRGKTYAHGFGTHADSLLVIDLNAKAQRFTAVAGLDDEVTSDPRSKNATAVFTLYGDGKKTLGQRPPFTPPTRRSRWDADLTGIKTLFLQVASTGESIDFTHADWADATIKMEGRRQAGRGRPAGGEGSPPHPRHPLPSRG